MTWAGISAQSSGYATARSHAYNQHDINDHAPHDVTTERQPPPGRPPPGTQTSAGRTRHSGLHAARGKQTYARSPKVYPGTRVRPRVLRASDLDVLRSAMTATASEPGQSSQRTGMHKYSHQFGAARCWTYEATLSGVRKRFGGEPFPHERARRSVVHGIDQATNVIIDCGEPCQ